MAGGTLLTMSNRSNDRGYRWAGRLGIACASAVVLVAMVAFAGCSEPLLAARDERSPFDRYDAVRNQHAPQYVENEFGRRQPNLAGRLGPKK